MDLKTFVSTTITQIFEGMKAAIEEADKYGGKVNPGATNYGDFKNRQSFSSENGIFLVREIEFDVAIAADEGTQTQGGISLLRVLGASGESRQGSSTTSRIKFAVPVVLPGSKHD